MLPQHSFTVGIAMTRSEKLQLVSHREPHHEGTGTLQESSEVRRARQKKEKYRESFLRQFRSACAGREDVEELIKSFVQMSINLENLQAVAFHTAADETYARVSREGLLEGSISRSPASEMPFNQPRLHPLIVALLAFHMGGALNAANSIQYCTWKSRGSSLSGMPDFLIEGDSSDVFEEYRLTLAWEVHDRRLTKPTGNLTLFQKEDKQPQPLGILTQALQGGPAGPITVVYDPKNAALWYDCNDTCAVRRSVSLDLHINTISGDDLELLLPECLTSGEAAGLTLWGLITGFPTRSYDKTFHRLLFASGAFGKTLEMLALLEVPVRSPQPRKAHQDLLERRYQEWQQDNVASVPSTLQGMQELRVSGVYLNPDDFLKVLYNKAFQDGHLPVGMDMMPQSPADAEREHARRFIRDRPAMVVRHTILDYQQCLTVPYTKADLVTTEQICEHGRWLRSVCFELAGTGFVDERGLLPAIGSLSATLGDAANGSKECRVDDGQLSTTEELTVFRVKTLYLFWCADWLARYFTNFQEGPAMIFGPKKSEFDFGKQRAVQIAKQLLRNWVAWSLLVESLPKGAFWVPVPKDRGM